MVALQQYMFIKIRNWKKLQKTAYIFYGLIYAHVMLLMVPTAFTGNTTYIFNVALYTIVFLTYAVMRVSKAYAKKAATKKQFTTSKAV